jgi:hypothetical protein
MTINQETGEYSFDEFDEALPQGFVDVWLDPAERDKIRPLADPGEPLWRIMKGLLDYRRALVDNLAKVELATEEGRLAGIRLQAEIRAIEWQFNLWVRQLSDPLIGEKGLS